MAEQQVYWFAARMRDKQEFTIRNFLIKLKLEASLDLSYYLPTKTVVRQLKYRKKQVEVPIIKNLIFVRATKQTACDLSNKYSVPLYYMKDLFTHAMLVVPDRQMEDFMLVMNLAPDDVIFDNEHLAVGHRVRVMQGQFMGIEGQVAKGPTNRTYVMIRIHDVLTASIKVPKTHLQIIKD